MHRIFLIPVLFIVAIWGIHIAHYFGGYNFDAFALYPRQTDTFFTILTSPLIHADWEHLVSNTFPILLLSAILFLSYEKAALKVWVLLYLFPQALVWLLGRPSYHIGASGIVYGLASYLFFGGLFRMDVKAIAIAFAVALFYGGMVWGVLPIQPGISWESHLLGAIVGALLAFRHRKSHLSEQEPYIPDEEPTTPDRKTFDDFIKQNQTRN